MNTNRWALGAIGLLVTVTGFGLLAWPFVAASWMLAIIFGASLISTGAASLAQFGASTGTKVFSTVLIVAGVLAIVFNEFTASALVIVVGATIIFLSVLWLLFGIAFGAGSSPLTLGPAILGAFIGIVPLIWPELALSVVAVLMGFMVTVWGISLLVSAFKKHQSNTIKTIRVIK